MAAKRRNEHGMRPEVIFIANLKIIRSHSKSPLDLTL